MLRAAILAICVIGAIAEAPFQEYGLPYPAAVKLAPYPAPHEEYGPPKEEEKPQVPIITKYEYDIPKTIPKVEAPYPAPTPVLEDAPYPAPAPVMPHDTYGVPAIQEYQAPAEPIVTKYEYDIPKTVVHADAPYPAPVYNDAPYPAPAPVMPHDTYGVPAIKEYQAPAEPIVTKYEYNIPKTVVHADAPYPAPVYNDAPYPAPAPVMPHDTYGVPAIKEYQAPVEPIVTKYEYDIPKTVVHADAPYPAPHETYGVPEVKAAPAKPIVTMYEYDIPKTIPKAAPYPAPYPAPAPVMPHDTYGVPAVKEVYVPAKPVVSMYQYDIPAETPKPAPYPAAEPVVMPHAVYGVPSF